MRTLIVVSAIWLSLADVLLPCTANAADAISIPMTLENNRPYIDLSVGAANGHMLRGHFYLDTGGGSLVVTARFAAKVGLKAHGPARAQEGTVLTSLKPLRFEANGVPISVAGVSSFATTKRVGGLQGTDADGVIPVRALARYIVTLDFRSGRLVLAQGRAPLGLRRLPGHITPVGMPVVDGIVDGKTVPFLLDTGATYSVMDADLLQSLLARHPEWPHRTGAIGPANMLVGNAETRFTMLRLGQIALGSTVVDGAGFVARPNAAYHFMSTMLDTTVVGSIGDNVWLHYAITLDFPRKRLWISGPRRLRLPRTATADVALEQRDGHYVIAAVSAKCDGLKAGDVVERIGRQPADGATLATLLDVLSGSPGTYATLKIRGHNSAKRVLCRRVDIP
jgi:hypothetical protein